MTVRGDPPRDHAGLVVLGYDHCLDLLRSEPIGRVAFLSEGDVHILPVHHRLVGHLIVFRTGDGPKLAAALDRAVVAFEVDGYDVGSGAGWSVLAKGRAEAVAEGSLLARLRTTGLAPWHDGLHRPEWIVIRTDEVTGRRLEARPEP